MMTSAPVAGRSYITEDGEPFTVQKVLTSDSVIGWLALIQWADGHLSVREPEEWPAADLPLPPLEDNP